MLKKILLLPLIVCVLGIVAFLLFARFKNGDLTLPEGFDDRIETVVSSNTSNKEYFTSFPVRLGDFVSPPQMYGLWPYGVRGNNSSSHNEGHPGWDFELKKGSKVYALSDLYIAQIHDGDTSANGKPLKVIEAYTTLQNKKFHIVYHSVVNLEPGVVEKAVIAEGKPLAEAGMALSDNSVMIHFGVFKPNDSVGVCPTPYFSRELQETINKMVAFSIDNATGKAFTSSCVGKIDKKMYMENYPNQVKYLGGDEEWE